VGCGAKESYRVSSRNCLSPTCRYSFLGFRCVQQRN
jgi:formylglycine-generating enzyme required for sulfatase activity